MCSSNVSVAVGSSKNFRGPDESLHSDQARRDPRSYSWEMIDNSGVLRSSHPMRKISLAKQSTNRMNVFENPQFRTWESSVYKAHKPNNLKAEAAMLSTLIARYGDKDLANMIVAAKTLLNSKRTKLIASKMENALLNKWIGDKKTATNIFVLLKLEKETGNLLKISVLRIWVSYVNMRREDPYELLYRLMRPKYQDDRALGIMLASATEIASTRIDALRLEKVLFMKWRTEQLTMDDAFKLLRLTQNEDNVLLNEGLKTWISYAKFLKKNPNEMLFSILKKKYTCEVLARKLVTAKENEKSRGVAEGLEVVQIKNWVNNEKTPDDVFKIFNLEKEGDKLFENPATRTFVAFVIRLDKTNSDEKLFSVLKARYDDEVLAKMIGEAANNPRTSEMTQGLRNQLWLYEKKSADDVYKLLKLDEKGSNILKTPEFSTWASYLAILKTNKQDYALLTLKLEVTFDSDLNRAGALISAKEFAFKN
ncbi:unnamed protein product [Phytophthora lilii]|uniref:Unnamed protein product n=1 Tax=Phytophthora lilii TaxID=2077276 RepID=A0A9W7D7V4_9STRA|nr:unnamed protein product [Phytophthora lilii]